VRAPYRVGGRSRTKTSLEQQDKRLENLHQQASTLYLQGEYVAALGAWRQLLKLDPRDERAREGVRLCEMLVEEEGGTVPPSLSSPTPPPTPEGAQPDSGHAIGFGIGEDLDEELDELDEMLGDGAATDWMDKPPQPPAAPPPATEAPEPGAVEFDVSAPPSIGDEAFNLDGADLPASPDAEAEIDAAFNFEAPAPPSEAPPEAPAPTEPAGATQPEDASAEGLQRRGDELMAEALEHYEAGQREDALTVLGRLAILDEGNQAARTFANHIRAEIEAQSGAPTQGFGAQPEAASTEAAPVEAPGSPEMTEDLLADPVFEPAQQAAPAPQIADGLIDFDGHGGESLGLSGPEAAEPIVEDVEGIPSVASGEEFDLEDAVVSDSPDDVTPTGAAEPAVATKAKLPMNKWLMIAAIALLALGGGYVALQFLGGSEADEADNTALAGPPPLGDLNDILGPPGESASTNPADPDPSPPVAATAPPGDLDEVLDRADAAYEEGNYAVAVLAYNEAMELDPRNEVARRRLEHAGEFYREQQEQLEQRSMAIKAFNDGDYRNALRILYRISPSGEDEAERFERYKFNGWYNMGLRALGTGDCRLARSNLREAQQVDPTDPDLQYALELSGSCFEVQDESYFDATRSLRMRALDE
jgi:tetratricopeptide (TPR) repeat protein